MENMLSRNSFPQICVVSVIQCVGNQDIQQEYVGSGSLGNQYVDSLVNPFAKPTTTPGEQSLVMRDDGTQKRGVPNARGEYALGNSFPQICVVPGNSLCESGLFHMVKIAHSLGYGSRMSVRNPLNLLINKE